MWPLKTKKQCSIRNTVENSLAQRFRSFASAAATEGVALKTFGFRNSKGILSAPLGAPEREAFDCKKYVQRYTFRYSENLKIKDFDKRSLFE